MNDLQILERLSEADEYAPHHPMPAAAWSRDVTHTEIDRRIGSARHPAKTAAAAQSWRTGRLVVATAFVAVLLVGAAVMLFSGSGTDVSPAVPETTQAPPTTQAVPPTTGAPPVATTLVETAIEESTVQPIVDRFVAAYNSHDPEALLALLDPAVTYESGIGRGGVEELRTELTYSFASDAAYDVIECRFNPRDDGSIRAACNARYSDVIDPVLTGTRTQSLGLTVVDGAIMEVTFGMSNNIQTLEAFYAWVSEQHPDVAERSIACFNPGACLLPVLTTESAELHRTMVEAYLAETDSSVEPGAEVDAEALAFAEGLMADLNGGEVDAAMARFPEGMTFRSAFFSREGLADWFEHGAAMDSTFELGECITPTGGVTRCEWYRSSEFEPYYPLREKVIYNIRLEDGEPVFAQINHEKADWWEIELQFMSWLAANHPEVGDTLYNRPGDVSGGPKFFEPLVAADLKKEYVALWTEAGRP